MRFLPAALAAALGLAAAATAQPKKADPGAPPPKPQTGPAFEQETFGRIPGKVGPEGTVTAYTLVNKNNVRVKVIDYGAIVTSVKVPDRDGKFGDVVLGFDNLDGYLKGHPYFGTNAGRCGNRIAKGKFTLDGKEYTLATNNGPNHLHGGKEGFDKKMWKAEPFLSAAGPGVKLQYTSKDGEEGYPGTLATTLSYTLTDDNALVVDMRATTDKPTVCNLAHHSYFNLAGKGDVLNHTLQVAAANYTPGDDTLIPTGKIAPVAGTPFDFAKAKPVGRDLKAAGGTPPAVGFDLNFALDKGQTEVPGFAARVTEPATGRTLDVLTTEPGLQFYTGNFLDGTLTNKGGAKIPQYGGLCLEAQKFPDSVNKPEWKDKSNAVLRPGETYRQTTVYKFGVAK